MHQGSQKNQNLEKTQNLEKNPIKPGFYHGFFQDLGFFKMLCVTKILLLAFIESNDEEDVTDTSDEYSMNKYIDKYCKKA